MRLFQRLALDKNQLAICPHPWPREVYHVMREYVKIQPTFPIHTPQGSQCHYLGFSLLPG